LPPPPPPPAPCSRRAGPRLGAGPGACAPGGAHPAARGRAQAARDGVHRRRRGCAGWRPPPASAPACLALAVQRHTVLRLRLADPRVGGGAGPAAGRVLAAWERQPPVAPPATWRAPPPAGFADARGMRLAALEPWRPVRRAALRAARHDATASLLTGCRATLTAHVHVSLHCDVSWWIIGKTCAWPWLASADHKVGSSASLCKGPYIHAR